MQTSDYTIPVAVVQLSPQQEKTQNIFLNNPAAQGYFDYEKLGKLFHDDITTEDTGFDQSQIYQLFGPAPFVKNEQESLDAMSEKLRQYTELQDRVSRQTITKDEREYYLVVVFRSNAQRAEFTDLLGLEDQRYQNGEDILATFRKLRHDDTT